MNKTHIKKSKVWLISVLSVLMATILILSGVGIYFHFSKNKNKPKTNIEIPLSWATDVWDGKSVSAVDFNENYANRGTSTKTINSAESFMHFINEVNNGKDFAGYKIYLNSHIDLNGYSINTIGSEEKPFKGIFDGSYYTIQNAKISGNALFGYTENATIKNLGVYNCEVKATNNASGLIAKAKDTQISDTFVRLGKIEAGENASGLVGEYISTQIGNKITNSFVDTELKATNIASLVGTLKINNDEANKVTISNCYYTTDKAYNNVAETDVDDDENTLSVNAFNFEVENSDEKVWQDYAKKEGSKGLSFNYPILRQFVKVFKTGSNYEGVLVDGNGNPQDVATMAEALKVTESLGTAELNLIAEEIYIEDQANIASGVVTINAVKDITILRGESNEESMFVATGTSKLVIGGNTNARNAETPKTITLDGKREYTEANNLETGSMIVSNGQGVEIGSNVVMQNNTNTTTGYGGAVLLYNTDTESTINASIKNCHSTNGGGGVAIIGGANINLVPMQNCSSEGNGGGLFIAKELKDTEAVTLINSLYGVKHKPSSLSTYLNGHINLEYDMYLNSSNSDDFVGCTADYNGGAIYSDGYTLSCSNLWFENNNANDGGAIYTNSSVQLTRCRLNGNRAEQWSSEPNIVGGRGGAIYLTSTGYLYSVQTSYSGNSAENQGGAIYNVNSDDYSVDIRDVWNDLEFYSYFNRNGGSYGGAIYSAGGLRIEGRAAQVIKFYENESAYGGAIHVRNTKNVLINYAKFEHNHAINNGGAIDSYGARIIVSDIVFSNNRSEVRGGAIALNDSSNYYAALVDGKYVDGKLVNGEVIEFRANSSGESGGAISSASEIKLTVGYFGGNETENYGGAIFSSGVLYLEGDAITDFEFNGNTANYGGAIEVRNSKAIFSYVQFNSNESTKNGGAIDALGARLGIDNSVFYDNKSTENHGGAIRLVNNSSTGVKGELTISATEFNQNTAANNGGAIANDGTTDITGGSFTGNSAKVGGAIFCADTLTTQSETTFTSNKASVRGGAINIQSGRDHILSSSRFGSNTVVDSTGAYSGYGGAVYTNATNAALNECTFKSNATIQGGAIYADNMVTVKGGTFSENTASSGSGGAILSTKELILKKGINDLTFRKNTAKYGGAIQVRNKATIEGATFTSNSVANNAGALDVFGATVNISETDFDSNSASVYGGAIMVTDNTNSSVVSTCNINNNVTFTENTANNLGGAICSYTNLNLTGRVVFNSNTTETYGGSIYSTGTLNIKGTANTNDSWVEILNGEAKYGGALTIRNSTATIENANFNNNSSTENGGAIDSFGANVTIKNSWLVYNSCGNRGGAVASVNNTTAGNGATLTLENVTAFENDSVDAGGAIYSDDLLTINGGSFSGNSAQGNGGHVYAAGEIYINYNSSTQTELSTETSFSNEDYQSITNGENTHGGAICINRATAYINRISVTYVKAYIGAAMHIRNAGTYTINNSSFDYNTATYNAGVLDIFGTTVTFKNSTLSSNSATNNHGGAINLADNGSAPAGIIAEGLTFNSNYSNTGGAVHSGGTGTHSFTDCVFLSNIAFAGNGGAIHCDHYSVTLNVTDCEFTSNYTDYSYSNGGAIWCQQIDATGSNFTSNTSHSSGGAIYLANTGTIHDCTFTTNYANGGHNTGGGAIYSDYNLTVNNSTFTENHADSSNGGAIVSGYAYIGASTFTGNSAGDKGGAVYTKIATCVGSSSFNSNTAAYGGAIYGSDPEGYHSMELESGVTFEDNSAEAGGAIYNESQTLDIRNNEFTGNEATNGNGGAILTKNVGYIYGTDTFSNNKASNYGGAIYAEGDYTISITGADSSDDYITTFSNNESGKEGGAIYLASGGVTTEFVLFDSNKTSSSSYQGGAIAALGSNSNYSVDINSSTFTNNNYTAVYTPWIPVTADYSEFSSNSSYGKSTIYANTAELSDCTFLNDNAGGIYLIETETTLTINNCSITIGSNSGGIANCSDLTISNTDLSSPYEIGQIITVGGDVYLGTNVVSDYFMQFRLLNTSSKINFTAEPAQAYSVYKEGVEVYDATTDNASGIIGYSDPELSLNWDNIQGKLNLSNIPSDKVLSYNGAKQDYIVVASCVDKPSVDVENFIYDGRTKTVSVPAFDENTMELTGTISAYDRGTYTASILPKEGYIWSDGTTNPIAFEWSIVMPEGFENATLYLPSHYTYEETAGENAVHLGMASISSSGSALVADLTEYIAFIPDVTTDGGTTEVQYLAPLDSLFYQNEKLTSIYIPNNITSAGSFNGCVNLTTVIFEDDGTITMIYERGFNYCTALKTVKLPNTLKELDYQTFCGCSSLEEIILPQGLQIIGQGAFQNCTALKGIVIPNTVQTIEEDAFLSCSVLQSVIFDTDSVLTFIGNQAFDECSSLLTITIPKGVTSIEIYTFQDCLALQTVYFEETSELINIGKYAFQDCSALTTISIPATVETIGDYAFDGCSLLHSVDFGENTVLESINNRVFRYCTKLINIEIPTSVTSIGEYAFYGCKYLVSLNIPSLVTSIGKSAFSGCVSLKNIVIPHGLTTINEYTFYDCQKLNNVEIPNSVTTIGDYVFRFCYELTNIDIPNSVTSIGGYAFQTCKALVSIEIPSSVTTFGANIFGSCSKLENIIAQDYSHYNDLIRTENLLTYYEDGLITYPVTINYTYLDGSTVSEIKLFNRDVKWAKVDGLWTLASSYSLPELSGELTYWEYSEGIAVTVENLTIALQSEVMEPIEIQERELMSIDKPNTNNLTLTYNGSMQSPFSNVNWVSVTNGIVSAYDKGTYTVSVVPATGYVWSDGTFDEVLVSWKIEMPEGWEDSVIYLPEHFDLRDCDDGWGIEGLSAAGQALVAGLSSYKMYIPSYSNEGTGFGRTNISYIMDNAFKDDTKLTSVKLLEGDYNTSIGSYAFANTGLTFVEIPSSWEYSNLSHTFANCASLEYVILNISMIGFDSYIFENCTSLVTVEFNGSSGEWDETLLSGCSSLQNIIISGDKYWYEESKSWWGNLEDKTTYVTNIRFDYADGSQEYQQKLYKRAANWEYVNGRWIYNSAYALPEVAEGNAWKYATTESDYDENPDSDYIVVDLAKLNQLLLAGTTNAEDDSGSEILILKEKLNNIKVTITADASDCGSVNGETEIVLDIPYGATYSVNGNVLTLNGEPYTATATSSNAQFSYEFLGWYINENKITTNGTITSETTIVAKFSSSVNSYTITWVNDDGIVLETDNNVAYGAMPSYDGATPTKASTAQYSYTFAGWDPEVATVTGSVTYTAKFTPTTRSYTITWVNDDGTVLETDNNVIYGAMPSYDGATPTKTATVQYTYTFAGWDPEVATVTGDATYTAKFDAITNQYTVSFNVAPQGYGSVNIEGPSASVKVDYDTKINESVSVLTIGDYTITATPIVGTDGYVYSFANWSGIVSSVTGNITITANFTRLENGYTITYNGLEGATVAGNPTSYTVNSEAITLNNPTKEYYTFVGWSGTGITGTSMVVVIPTGSTGNREYTANWEEITVDVNITVSGNVTGNTYGVTVIDAEGNETTYNESFKLHQGQAYTFKVNAKLISDSTNNKYQILKITMGDATKTVYSPSTINLTNSTLTNITLLESATINFEFISAYSMKFTVPTNTVRGILSDEINVVSGEMKYITTQDMYIISEGTKFTFVFDTTPTSATEYKYVNFVYTITGESSVTASINSSSIVMSKGMTQNTQYTDLTIGTYVYEIATDGIATIQFNVVKTIHVERDETVTEEPKDPETSETIDVSATFTSATYNLTEVLDAELSTLFLFEDRWYITTPMTTEQLQYILDTYYSEYGLIIQEDSEGLYVDVE